MSILESTALCAECARPFAATSGGPGRPRTLCDDCRGPRARRQVRDAKRRQRARGGGGRIPCETCSTPLVAPASRWCAEHRPYRTRPADLKGTT